MTSTTPKLPWYLRSNKALGLALVFGAAVAAYNGAMIGERNETHGKMKSMTTEQAHETYKDLCVRRNAFNVVWEQAYTLDAGDQNRDEHFTVPVHPNSTAVKNCAESEHTQAMKSAATALSINKSGVLFGSMVSLYAVGGLVWRSRRLNAPKP